MEALSGFGDPARPFDTRTLHLAVELVREFDHVPIVLVLSAVRTAYDVAASASTEPPHVDDVAARARALLSSRPESAVKSV
jgi:hypothetical protein